MGKLFLLAVAVATLLSAEKRDGSVRDHPQRGHGHQSYRLNMGIGRQLFDKGFHFMGSQPIF